MRRRASIFALCFVLVACAQKPAQVPRSAPTVEAQGSADAEMESASQQALATLDLFIQEIESPHPGRTFVAVKARFFPPGDIPQDIWVDEVTYSDGAFRGNMGDDVPSLKLRLGEQVTVGKDEIVDWMIVEDGKLIGGYTIRLAVRRMSPEEKRRFFQTLDYTIEEE
jgi:uncharacterized protein YegJ (DUF2314 family)